MNLPQELLSTGRQPDQPFLSTDPIMFGLMNIILVSPYKKITVQVIYYFNNILKVIFKNWTSLTSLHVNLIVHPLNFVIQQVSHMTLIHLLLE